jgi:tRNA(Ile)-lysidine synthase
VLRRALAGPCHLPPGATLLVAVSGGADSTALLAALVSLAREHALVLHAAHLDHGLRGHDSAADRTHVRALCARLGVPLCDARWDCAARMRRRGLRGEAGLRTLRHEWLTSVARRLRAAGIATAHTADDQLETLLLRLGRGTGLTGAAGMRARRGLWLKPLLEATRADLEADLRHAGLAWRDDASNATLAHTRNRVRHGVVPALLDALGVPAGDPARRRAALARRAQALAAELGGAHATLARGAIRAQARLARADGLDRPGLVRLPAPLARLVLRRWWAQRGPQGPTAPGLTARHLEPLRGALAGARRRAEVALPAGWRANRGGRHAPSVPRHGHRPPHPSADVRGRC